MRWASRHRRSAQSRATAGTPALARSARLAPIWALPRWRLTSSAPPSSATRARSKALDVRPRADVDGPLAADADESRFAAFDATYLPRRHHVDRDRGALATAAVIRRQRRRLLDAAIERGAAAGLEHDMRAGHTAGMEPQVAATRQVEGHDLILPGAAAHQYLQPIAGREAQGRRSGLARRLLAAGMVSAALALGLLGWLCPLTGQVVARRQEVILHLLERLGRVGLLDVHQCLVEKGQLVFGLLQQRGYLRRRVARLAIAMKQPLRVLGGAERGIQGDGQWLIDPVLNAQLGLAGLDRVGKGEHHLALPAQLVDLLALAQAAAQRLGLLVEACAVALYDGAQARPDGFQPIPALQSAVDLVEYGRDRGIEPWLYAVLSQRIGGPIDDATVLIDDAGLPGPRRHQGANGVQHVRGAGSLEGGRHVAGQAIGNLLAKLRADPGQHGDQHVGQR